MHIYQTCRQVYCTFLSTEDYFPARSGALSSECLLVLLCIVLAQRVPRCRVAQDLTGETMGAHGLKMLFVV
jgi:hypothetical protein